MSIAFVTGATGFKGVHLVNELRERGYQVHALVRPRAGVMPLVPGAHAVYPGDLTDGGSLRRAIHEARPDVVFHLAAQSHVRVSWDEPELTHRVNGDGTFNLLEAVRWNAPKAAVVLAGTSEEYGLVEESELPITEKHPLRPLSPYGVSKVKTDLLGWQYFRSHGMRVVRMRAFNTEGPGRPDSFVPSGFAAQLARIEAGVQEPIVKHGNLDAVRDYTDVRDTVRGYVIAGTLGAPGEVYNIASGTGYTLRECLERLIGMSTAKGVTTQEDPARMRPSDVPRLIGDATKLRGLGWTPTISWDQTLRDLLSWWRRMVTA